MTCFVGRPKLALALSKPHRQAILRAYREHSAGEVVLMFNLRGKSTVYDLAYRSGMHKMKQGPRPK